MENTNKTASLPFFGFPRLVPLVRKYRKVLLTMIVCGLFGSVMDIGLPLLQKYALDHFIGGRTLDTMPAFVALYLAGILFSSVMNFIAGNGAISTEVRVNRDLRAAAFNHLQTLSFSYFNQNRVG